MLKSTDYVEFQLENFKDKNLKIGTFSIISEYLQNSVLNFIPDQYKDKYLDKAFNVTYEILKNINEGNTKDLNKIQKLKELLLEFCWSEQSLNIMYEFLRDEHQHLKSFTLSTEQKKKILYYLYARGQVETEKLSKIKEKIELNSSLDEVHFFFFK